MTSVVLAGVFLWLPPRSPWGALIYVGLGFAELAAITVGIARYRSADPRPWYLLWAGAAFYSLANVVWFGGPVVLGWTLPFPSVADPLFVAAYLCYIAGLVVLIRARTGRGQGGAGALIDAAIITVGAVVIAWEYLLVPIFAHQHVSGAAHLVAGGYPLLDLALVALLAGTLLTRGARSPAFWFLTAGVLSQLCADGPYTITLLRDTFYYGHPLTVGWLLSFGCLGAAALHPSMRTLGSRVADPPHRTSMSVARLAFLGLAAITVPAVYAFQDERNPVKMMTWTTLAFVLCIARMAALVRDLDRNGAALARRERELHATVDLLHKSEGHLAHQARHDALTGLPNRVLFDERTDAALARPNRPVAVMLLDIDGFKTVNDSLGHTAGDALLVGIAGRLLSGLRPTDIVARLGGDEFTVLAEGVDEAGALHLASRLLRTLDDPFDIDGRQIFARASLGIAVCDSECAKQELLRDADAAMYEAKRKGGQRFEVFSADMHARVVDRLALECDLREAELGTAMTVHYQPIVDLRDGQLTGFEALLRWRHPERGLVPPDEFVPIAEQIGAIVPLGRWVLDQACRQGRVWELAYPHTAPLGMNVNVSARQLADPSFVEDVSAILRETGFEPANLTLEITETMIVTDEHEALDCLLRLKRLGVRISIDDFGTGYSSLRHLERFPVDELKIDKSFIDGIGSGSSGSGMALATIRLAQSLHIDVVAEGIERADQLADLRGSACTRGQGYYFWRPMQAAVIDALLSERDSAVLPLMQPPTVLVVDDDDDIRGTLVRILSRAGFDTFQAPDGRTALDVARRSRLDAVVLDVALPDLDGVRVCHELKRVNSGVAVVHLSGSAVTVADRVRALHVGADGYLTKPIDSAELIATVRALLRPRARLIA